VSTCMGVKKSAGTEFVARFGTAVVISLVATFKAHEHIPFLSIPAQTNEFSRHGTWN
jgi:hypothetical protein